jgi:hypothetical protein
MGQNVRGLSRERCLWKNKIVWPVQVQTSAPENKTAATTKASVTAVKRTGKSMSDVK